MADIKSGIILQDNEKLVMEMEAELWSGSNNPVARFFGSIQKFISMILGTRIKGYLVITDQRVIQVTSTVACYCFTVGKEIKYIMPSSIKEIGYVREATFLCCCPAFKMYFESYTQRTMIQLKTSFESDIANAVNAFYYAMKK